MSVYPYNLTPEGAPTDSTGSWPAVAGYTPVSTGRRVAIFLVDMAILGLAIGLMLFVLMQETSWSLFAGVGLYLAYIAVLLWALFGRASRVAGLLMKAQYVDVRTGRLAPVGLLAKQILMNLLGAVSLMIAPVIMVFATVQPPMNRNWFDRMAKVMLVDGRSGRKPGEPFDPGQAPAPAPRVSSVQFDPQAAPTPWGVQPPPPSAVTPVTNDGGVITGVPGRALSPQPGAQPPAVHPPASSPPSVGAPPPAARPTFTPPPGTRERREPLIERAEPVSDHTMLAPSALDGTATPTIPEITLDGTFTLHVSPPLVFGRNPVAPGSHPDAVVHRVDDGLLSKTHLLLGRDETSVWVIDLNSTNGTVVAQAPDAEPIRIEPGRRVRLPEGSTVQFGRHRVTVG